MIIKKKMKLIENIEENIENSVFPFFYRQLEESNIKDDNKSINYVQSESAILYNSNKMQCYDYHKFISRCL